MRAHRDICGARNLPHTCDDAWGGNIIAAACTHIGATVEPARLEGVWLAAPYIGGNFDPENGIRIENGHIAVPQRPGLGITPDGRCSANPSPPLTAPPEGEAASAGALPPPLSPPGPPAAPASG